MESSVQGKDKRIAELTDKVRHYEGVIRDLEQQAVAPPTSSSHQQLSTSAAQNNKLNTNSSFGAVAKKQSAASSKAVAASDKGDASKSNINEATQGSQQNIGKKKAAPGKGSAAAVADQRAD